MTIEVDLAGVFFETNLEILHDCLKPVFSNVNYRYKPQIEIYIEHDNFEFWVRDSDRKNTDYAEGLMDYLLCGTISLAYDEAKALVGRVVNELENKKIIYQIDILEQTEDGAPLRDMEHLTNIDDINNDSYLD